ncbi:hypothetical protein L0F63_003559 [Massospora cicadina]|nr:hypothetical protein L0F63_003559 [Massospora cicadina]
MKGYILFTWVVAARGLAIVDGGCTLAGSRVFALGGYSDYDEEILNSKVYFLEMDALLEVGATGAAPWVEAGPDLSQPLGQGQVFVFGGSMLQRLSPLQVLNATTASLELVGESESKHAVAGAPIMGASLVQNDLIPTEYIAYGGRTSVNNTKRFLKVACVFDSVRNRWIDDNESGPPNAGHVAAVFQGVMYVVGGIANYNQTIDAYDIRSSEWYKVPTKGTPPPGSVGFSSTQHGKQLFIAGAFTDDLYILDLETKTWTSNHVPGFKGALEGCLVYRRGFLLHAFGIFDGQANNQTQIIDTRSWSLTNSADMRSANPMIPGPVIVGLFTGCVGFLLLIALLVSLIVYYKRRSARPRDSLGIEPPKLLTEPIWIDAPAPTTDTELTLINPYSSYYDDLNLKTRTMLMLQTNSDIYFPPKR